MRLSNDDFTAWVDQFYRALGQRRSWDRVAEDAAMVRNTLDGQRRRDAVDPAAVLQIARRYEADPLLELSQLQAFSGLAQRANPSAQEVLSALPPGILLEEFGRRLRGKRPLGVGPEFDWPAWPLAVSAWMGYCAGAGWKKRLVSANLIGQAALDSRLRADSTWGISEMISCARAVGLDPVFGLMLSGRISASEAHLSATVVTEVLSVTATGDLQVITRHAWRFIERHGSAVSAT